MFHTIVSIKNDGHYFCRAGGNRPDGLNEPVTSNVLKLFPFAMVMCSVVWFYFCPEHILSDIVNDWHDADTLEKIRIVRLYLKTSFILTVVGVVISYLSSDKFMPVKRRK
ncbi:hypothetical protein ABUU04_00895 [Escherichia coli]|uniref:hypothetical protein n=1 Tax=Escherichia coli TaxID=562 RepID=UPI00335F764C